MDDRPAVRLAASGLVPIAPPNQTEKPIESTLVLKRHLPQIPAVDPADANERVDRGAILVDVREQNEWDQVRIPGASLKPLSQANSWYQDLPSDGEIIFYCRSGQRSGQIVHALIEQVGMTNVINLSGGIVGWIQHGLPVED